jgi:predicted RNA binding protein YcfA (HicA-like mRNA interferase family)
VGRAPALEVQDVRRALTACGFEHKRTRGSHEQWEGHVDGIRRVVTVDANDAPFLARSRSLKSIIRHSGIPKRDFYAAAGKPLP